MKKAIGIVCAVLAAVLAVGTLWVTTAKADPVPYMDCPETGCLLKVAWTGEIREVGGVKEAHYVGPVHDLWIIVDDGAPF